MIASQLEGGVFGWMHKPPDICLLSSQAQSVEWHLRRMRRAAGVRDGPVETEIADASAVGGEEPIMSTDSASFRPSTLRRSSGQAGSGRTGEKANPPILASGTCCRKLSDVDAIYARASGSCAGSEPDPPLQRRELTAKDKIAAAPRGGGSELRRDESEPRNDETNGASFDAHEKRVRHCRLEEPEQEG